MIKKIYDGDNLLAIIVSNKFNKPGIHFFTPNDFSQQLAYMKHPKGKTIIPHVHNQVSRHVEYTQEILFIKSGKIRVDFYDMKQQYLESHVLSEHDVILLIKGGHGFEILEDLEMFEIKQGPYVGESDKTRFAAIQTNKIKIK
jgi:mannose-6-phosphate isomerase-like protein (cupin superfamily)